MQTLSRQYGFNELAAMSPDNVLVIQYEDLPAELKEQVKPFRLGVAVIVNNVGEKHRRVFFKVIEGLLSHQQTALGEWQLKAVDTLRIASI